jgi:hypothetical protein
MLQKKYEFAVSSVSKNNSQCPFRFFAHSNNHMASLRTSSAVVMVAAAAAVLCRLLGGCSGELVFAFMCFVVARFFSSCDARRI